MKVHQELVLWRSKLFVFSSINYFLEFVYVPYVDFLVLQKNKKKRLMSTNPLSKLSTYPIREK